MIVAPTEASLGLRAKVEDAWRELEQHTSGALTAALVSRLQARGGQVVCGARVDRIQVRSGIARGVHTGDGRWWPARRAGLAGAWPRAHVVGQEVGQRRLVAGDLVHPDRPQVVHRRREADGAGDQVMVLGHFDTLWELGQIERMPFRTVDGRLHGPGIFDMKSGIAVAMLACRALAFLQLPRPPLVMLLTTDEEIGSGSSRRVIEAEALRSRAVLVLEPPLPGGGVKTSRKGVGEFELTVHGVSAHAGIAPAAGANALHELARQILAIQGLQDLERGLSVNVTVASAGSRSNVIPDLAQATIDVRVATMDDAKVIDAEIRRQDAEEASKQSFELVIVVLLLLAIGGYFARKRQLVRSRPAFECPALSAESIELAAIALGRSAAPGLAGEDGLGRVYRTDVDGIATLAVPAGGPSSETLTPGPPA